MVTRADDSESLFSSTNERFFKLLSLEYNSSDIPTTRTFDSEEAYKAYIKKLKVIEESVNWYNKSNAEPTVSEPTIDNDSRKGNHEPSSVLRDINSATLDALYLSDHDNSELKPVLEIARNKNKKPSELMREDSNYLKLIDTLSLKEAIPEINASEMKVDLNNFFGVDSSDQQGDISLSINTPDQIEQPIQLNQTTSAEDAQQAKLTLDLVNKSSIDAEDLAVAKKHDIPPSVIMTENSEIKKLLDQYKASPLDTNLDTPVTFDFMQNAEFAVRMKPAVAVLQGMEKDFRDNVQTLDNVIDDIFTSTYKAHVRAFSSPEKVVDNNLYKYGGLLYQNTVDRINTDHSTGILDNIKHRILKSYVGYIAAINWLLQDSFLDVNLMGSPVSSFINRSLVEMSKVVETMPHNLKGNAELKEKLREGDFEDWASFLYDNSGIIADKLLDDLLNDKLPSLIVARLPLPEKIKNTLSAAISTAFVSSTSDIVDASDKEPDSQKVMRQTYKKLMKRVLIDVAFEHAPKIKSKNKWLNDVANKTIHGVAKDLATKVVIDQENLTLEQAKEALYTNSLNALLSSPLPNDNAKKTSEKLGNKIGELFEGYPKEMSAMLIKMAKDSGVKADGFYISDDAFRKAAKEKGISPESLYRSVSDRNQGIEQLAIGGDVKVTLPELLQLNRQVGYSLIDDAKASTNGMTPNELVTFTKKAEASIEQIKAKQEQVLFNYNQAFKKYKKFGVNEPETHAVIDATLTNSLIQLAHDDNLLSNNLSVVIDNGASEKGVFIQVDAHSKQVTIDLNQPINFATYVRDTRKLFVYQLMESANSKENNESLKELSSLKRFLGTDDLNQLTNQQENRLDTLLSSYLNSNAKEGRADLDRLGKRFQQWSDDFYMVMMSTEAKLDSSVTHPMNKLRLLNLSSRRVQAPYGRLVDNSLDVQDLDVSQKEFNEYERFTKESTNNDHYLLQIRSLINEDQSHQKMIPDNDTPLLERVNQDIRHTIENENRSQSLAFEENVLAKKILTSSQGDEALLALTFSSDETLKKLAEEYLKDNLSEKLDLDSYLNTMQKENKKSKEAFKQNKWVDALTAKRKERLNHLIYLTVLDMKRNDQKIQKLIKSLDNSSVLLEE